VLHDWRTGRLMETFIIGGIALLLFLYLLAAIVWPEKF
jgi:K+-transporting ATPase KdpF subunit